MQSYFIHCKSFILCFLLFSSIVCYGRKPELDSTGITTSTKYLPIANDRDRISVKATVMNCPDAYFRLDTGTNGRIIIDSTFFYKNIDTTNLKRVSPKYKMYYWRTYYEGNIPVKIGNNVFYYKRVEVNNQRRHYSNLNYDLIGLIGEEAFLNKISVIDFDKNEIAFFDSITIDSTYYAIPLYSLNENLHHNRNQKFINVEGFKTKNGNKKKAYFLFDTGCGQYAIMMKTSFAKDLKLPAKRETLHGTRESHYRWGIDSLALGAVKMYHVPVRSVTKDSFDYFEALEGGDGLFGMPLIRRFNIILDYKKNVLYLKVRDGFKNNTKIQSTKLDYTNKVE